MSSTARAVLAGGLVSLNLFNSVTQAYDGFGENLDADKFEIKPNFEEKTSTSRSHLDYGQARASVIIPQPTELTIELSASSSKALAMQFQGLVQSLTQSSGSLAAVDVTVAAVGVWLPLGKRNIAEAGFEVTNAGDTVTYVLGTHYEVNWLRGEIRIIPGAAGIPAASDVLKVTGTYGAVDGTKILGGRVTQVRAQARFDGQNLVNSEALEVDVHECVLGANNGFDFLNSEYVNITLTGKIVTPAGKTEGYEVRFPQTANT
jgi:hypothetical protein